GSDVGLAVAIEVSGHYIDPGGPGRPDRPKAGIKTGAVGNTHKPFAQLIGTRGDIIVMILQGAEQAVHFAADAGGEIKRIEIPAVASVAEFESPQAIDGNWQTGHPPERTQESTR